MKGSDDSETKAEPAFTAEAVATAGVAVMAERAGVRTATCGDGSERRAGSKCVQDKAIAREMLAEYEAAWLRELRP